MRRIRFIVLALTISAIAGCSIERTPEEFIDRRPPDEAARTAAAQELRARLLALGPALSRGDVDAAVRAVLPPADVYVAAPADSMLEQGIPALSAAFAEIADPETGIGVRSVHDVVVAVAPRVDVAWFNAALSGAAAEDGVLRASGVFVLHEGSWRLVQLDLSQPVAREAPPAD